MYRKKDKGPLLRRRDNNSSSYRMAENEFSMLSIQIFAWGGHINSTEELANEIN